MVKVPQPGRCAGFPGWGISVAPDPGKCGSSNYCSKAAVHGDVVMSPGGHRMIENGTRELWQRHPSASERHGADKMPGGYAVRDANGPTLAFVYSRDNEDEARQAKVLTKDEARRIAINIARLPEPLGKGERELQAVCARSG